jgi:hypothetical protein
MKAIARFNVRVIMAGSPRLRPNLAAMSALGNFGAKVLTLAMTGSAQGRILRWDIVRSLIQMAQLSTKASVPDPHNDKHLNRTRVTWVTQYIG